MSSSLALDRFIKAQSPFINSVERELKEGCKKGHWMWFVFPQLSFLGFSDTSKYFGIKSIDEAKSYLKHNKLGNRLLYWTQLTLQHNDKTAAVIFLSLIHI